MAEKKVKEVKTAKPAKPVKTAKAAETAGLTRAALESRLGDLKKEAMNQRFQLAAGQLPKTHIIRKTRREIARVKTELNKK